MVRLFENGFSPRLTTPRLAKRFSNSIVFTLPILAGEVNPIDFILMEGIRVFYPDAYVFIRDNSKYFLLNDTLANVGKGPDEYREIRAKAFEALEPNERGAVESLVEYLFPRTIRTVMHVTYEQYPEEYRDQRVCSPAYFDRYFAYAVPKGDVSDQLIGEFVASISGLSAQEIAPKLASIFEHGDMGGVLRRLSYKTIALDAETCGTLVKAIISVGHLFQGSDGTTGIMPVSHSAWFLSEDLLRRIQWDDRQIVIRSIVRNSEPLTSVASWLWWITPTKPSRIPPIIPDASFGREMFELIAARIRDMLQSDSVFDASMLPYTRVLLYCWLHGASRDEVQSYLVAQFRASPENLSRFLTLFAPVGMTIGRAGAQIPFIGDLDQDHYAQISKLLDPNVVQESLCLVYGDLMSSAVFESWRDSDLMPDLRLAHQFTHLHTSVQQERLPATVEEIAPSCEDQPDVLSQKESDEH
jgi:hypothetical protein